jgi:hypothetical protein
MYMNIYVAAVSECVKDSRSVDCSCLDVDLGLDLEIEGLESSVHGLGCRREVLECNIGYFKSAI